MNTGGFYTMRRGWMDHPAFRSEPLCERAAYQWLVEHAAYAKHERVINGQKITVERGQLVESRNSLAHAWRWAPSGAYRFLVKLKAHSLIDVDTKNEQGLTVVTVCGYGEIQNRRGKSEQGVDRVNAKTGQATGQATGQGQLELRPDDHDEIRGASTEGGQATGQATGQGQAENRTAIREKKKKKEKKEKRESSTTDRRTALPDTPEFRSTFIERCRELRPELDGFLVLQKFEDYCRMHGRRYADWHAAARNWIRREHAPAPPAQAHPSTARQRGDNVVTLRQAAQRLMRKAEENDE